MSTYNIRMLIGPTNNPLTVTESGIISASSHRKLWDNELSVGNCVTGELDALLLVQSSSVPRNGRIAVQVRDKAASTNDPWINKGVFFVFTRETDRETGGLHIIAYDASFRTEQPFATPGAVGQWPRTDSSVMSEIATRTGAAICSASQAILINGYTIQYPGIVIQQSSSGTKGDGSMTMREVAGYIAGLYGGNWIIDNNGEWRLVQIITPT